MKTQSIVSLFIRLMSGALLVFAVAACDEGTDDPIPSADGDTDSDSDTDSDGDSDTDSDGDSDTDSDGDTDSDTDSDTDTDADTETDTGPAADYQYSFDANVETWYVDFAEKGGVADTGLQSNTELTWDGTEGDPDAGSIKLDIPFDAPADKLHVAVAIGSTEDAMNPPVDLSGKTITARIKLGSGLSSNMSALGGAKLFVKTGAGFVWANGPWVNLDPAAGWVNLSINIDSPDFELTDYDGTEVVMIGVEIATNDTALATDIIDAVVYIDSINW